PVYGDGTNIRDWLYVEDHCSAVDRIIRQGQLGEVYNIGGCNEWTNIDIARLICETLDELAPRKSGVHAELIEYVTDRPGHDWRYAIDNTKIQNELKWNPSIQFEQGIRKTIEWYLKNRDYLNRK
ncbi:MAG: GDP-mannose 4,6-dehydratase, partial [Gammaproteobacteria bacterium]|nr:GDP-mannose 4,6-dehydratase [Gammaproteobacteria bacterium]